MSKTCHPKLGKDLVLRKLGIQMLSICALLGEKKEVWKENMMEFKFSSV